MERRKPIQWCPDTYWNHSSFSKHRQVVFRNCFTPSIFWFFIWPLQRANGKGKEWNKTHLFLIFSFMSENHMEKNVASTAFKQRKKMQLIGLTMEGLQQTTPKLSTKTMNNQTCKTKEKRNNLGDPWLWVKRIPNIFLWWHHFWQEINSRLKKKIVRSWIYFLKIWQQTTPVRSTRAPWLWILFLLYLFLVFCYCMICLLLCFMLLSLLFFGCDCGCRCVCGCWCCFWWL